MYTPPALAQLIISTHNIHTHPCLSEYLKWQWFFLSIGAQWETDLGSEEDMWLVWPSEPEQMALKAGEDVTEGQFWYFIHLICLRLETTTAVILASTKGSSGFSLLSWVSRQYIPHSQMPPERRISPTQKPPPPKKTTKKTPHVIRLHQVSGTWGTFCSTDSLYSNNLTIALYYSQSTGAAGGIRSLRGESPSPSKTERGGDMAFSIRDDKPVPVVW